VAAICAAVRAGQRFLCPTPLPYAEGEFDAVISISIFTHLTEKSQDEFLADLQRVSRKEGSLSD
jgi:cyclopropane fatty-acyl-phospholipid synthase-like methyltransferase